MPPPPNILIVEDEKTLADNIKKYLDRRVPNVRVVGDGEHAVTLLETFVPDAIVMDYRLPGMDGLDTYTAMTRQCRKQIDCVMISGDATESLSQSASDRGIRSVLPKPFSFSDLLRHLEPSSSHDVEPDSKPSDNNSASS